MRPINNLIISSNPCKPSKKWKNGIDKFHFPYQVLLHSLSNFEPIERSRIFIETKILTDLHLNFIYNWGWKNNETH